MDAFDKGSYIKIIPEQNKIIGYTTRNSGGVPDNFKNYFVIEFDKPFTYQASVAVAFWQRIKKSRRPDMQVQSLVLKPVKEKSCMLV